MIDVALVLAAGRGSRLRPLTDTIPKALVNVRGRSLLDRILDDLFCTGVERVIVVTGYLGDTIEAHLAKRREHARIATVSQHELDGTGGAVRLVQNSIAGDFLVVFGDSLFAPNAISELVGSAFSNAIAVTEVSDPTRYGVVVCDPAGQITEIDEKPARPKSNLAIAGAYKFEFDALRYFPRLTLSERGEYEIPDAIRLMLRDKKVGCVRIAGMIDVGTLDQLAAVNHPDFSFGH